MRKNNLVFVFIGLTLLLLFTSDARACICAPESTKSRVNRMKTVADAIFVGTVETVEQKYGSLGKRLVYKVTLTVTLSWKKSSPTTIEVFTPAGCDVFFEVGQKYLVYARRNTFDVLETDLCMGTGLMEFRTRDVKKLGKGIVMQTNS